MQQIDDLGLVHRISTYIDTTVGGVYTIPKKRRKGFAKALMNQLIFDYKSKLSLHKLIIFTGKNENRPA